MTALEKELVAKYGEAERARIARGLAQVSKFWRQEAVDDFGKADGDAAALAAFVRDNYAGDVAARDALFSRMMTRSGRMILAASAFPPAAWSRNA